MATTTRSDLLTALGNLIQAAPEAERSKFADALEAYATTYSRGYRDMTRGTTLIASLLDTMEEAAECRIERDSTGTPVQGGRI